MQKEEAPHFWGASLKIGNTARMLCIKSDGQIARNRLSSLSP